VAHPVLIVFDLDGTLIDSSRDLADSTNALIEEHGGTPLGLDEVTAMVGKGASVLVRRALAAAGLKSMPRDALERFLAHYDKRLTRHTRPYPGIPETLRDLRAAGWPLAVLTNKPQRQTVEILDRLDLAPEFFQVIGGDTDAGRKPDPTGLLQIVTRAGATPASTVLVGDSAVDLETARNADTRICLTRYGFGYRFTGEEFRGDELFVDRPDQLLSVLSGSEEAEGAEGTG
jgi:phosphoglycolate phosphatase